MCIYIYIELIICNLFFCIAMHKCKKKKKKKPKSTVHYIAKKLMMSWYFRKAVLAKAKEKNIYSVYILTKALDKHMGILPYIDCQPLTC